MREEDDILQLIQSAIQFENEDLLVDLVSANPGCVELRDGSGLSPLMLAAYNGRIKALDILITMTPDCVDAQNRMNGKTALHIACERGQLSSVDSLLKAGADPSILDRNGYCALEVAHMSGHSALATILIDAIQAEESRVQSCHETLLTAAVNGDIELIKEILASKKNLTKILNGSKGKGALLVACENGRLEAVQFLLQDHFRHLNLLVEEISGDSILHAAISSQNILLVRLILQNYPTLASKSNKEGSSVLHWAVRARNVDIVQLLLQFPYPEYALVEIDNDSLTYRFAFDLNSGDGECRTALYLSVLQSDVEILTTLLEMTLPMEDSSLKCPFLVDTYCTKGRTPLMVAAKNNNVQLISILLSHGADINLPLAILDEGETRAVGSGALLEAARVHSIEVAKLLLAKGAVDTSNRALRMAISRKSESIVLLLLSRLAYPDNEMRVNKRNVELGQMAIGESLLPSFLVPSKGVIINWSEASLSSLSPQWISAAAMHINTRMRTTTLSFAAITRVDLSSNKLDSFPPLLWQLPSLRILNLSSNKLTAVDLPSGNVYSSGIETLILRDNSLSSIPSALLLLLTALSTLDISNNHIEYLPDTIWMCPSLKELNGSGNNISALPSLPRVTRRVLDTTTDNETPLKTTTRVIVRRSKWQDELGVSLVEEVDEEEGSVSSLTLNTLNLSHNKLRMFPTCLACISPRLSNLSLSHNLLTTICSLTALPPSLRSLDVSHNSLTQLFSPNGPVGECHAGIGGGGGRRSSPTRQSRSRSKSAVRSQRALSVSRSGEGMGSERERCSHRRHNNLKHLKTLNVSSNRLTTIILSRDETVFTPSLATLDASHNEIVELDGVSLSRLSALSVLSLSHNPLVRVPAQLGVLSHVWSLSLKDCPLSEPLLSIVNGHNAKTSHVLAHLRGILEESKPFNYLNLFILGQSGVGKSTLADAIKGEGTAVKGIGQGKCARMFECKMTVKRSSTPLTLCVWDTSGEMSVRPLIEYTFCRRAVYVVVFRVTEGTEAIHSLTHFLLSIQTRAPNASLVLVGSHEDELSNNSVHSSLISDVERGIRHRVLSREGENSGIPRIVDLLFVSLKRKSDIRRVISSVMRAAEDSRIGKEMTLSHNIPYSHICLFKRLREMSDERRKNGKDYIITQSSLIHSTKEFMRKKVGRDLRDETELSLALSFAREAGRILRVGESSQSPLVILDPLSFLDTLSLILSIRSGSRPAGIIPLSALSSVRELSPLGVHLVPFLHKMSLVVSCHSNLLLLPSLLPDEFSLRSDSLTRLVHIEARPVPINTSPITNINWSHRHMNLVRLYSMVYVPNDLWPRLISRLTCDENICRAIGQLVKTNDLKWSLWQSGVELMNGKDRLVVMKEFLSGADANEKNIHSVNWNMRVEGKWRKMDIASNASLVLYIPMVDSQEKEEYTLWTKVICLIVDAVDCLLEDWYPSLGTRFVHSSQGDLLVKRLVVCPSCSPFSSPLKVTRDDSHTHKSHSCNEGTFKNRSKTVNELSTLQSSSVSLFSIEECMEAARIEDKEIECPQHGIICLSSISADVLFLDMDTSLRMDGCAIKRDRLIGRGAFGFVFRAHIKTINSLQSYEIAEKMMEPCDPGGNARISAVNEYKAVLSKWKRDSLEYSTRAYLSARQEVGLLSRLSHPNALSLLGITSSPLSLIVEMAPLGSLRHLLTSYRKSDAKLSIGTLVESALQVAKALEYLHSLNIVYRDLKSENVLVWRFPPPFCMGEVQLKLGDYGISRQGLPSGLLKGFGGTEGFMAPEIVKWNGEEEYSLKVDIFSFGMFLYELISLKLPFESEEHVKEKIVNGCRPLLMPSECLWPCCVLDVLSSCWSPSPLSRPSSSQLVSLLSSPELSNLIDTLILPSLPLHILSPSTQLNQDNDDVHIWTISQSTIDIYSCTIFGWVECTSISMVPSWGKGRIYSCESSDWLWKVGESNEIALLPLNFSQSQCVTMPQLDNHPLISTPVCLSVTPSLYILPSKFSLHLLTREDESLSSFSLIESLTSPFQILSFAFLNHHSNRQLWTGHEGGVITAHFISSDHRFSFSSSFSHPDRRSLPVAKLLSSKDGTMVWSYLEGCSRIFCWDGVKRSLSAQLDIRKVQPASETIHTLEMDCTCDISSMCVWERGGSVPLLFVGTIEGCLVVLSALSLQPLSACRPYTRHLNTLLVLDCKNGEETQPPSATTSSEGAMGWMREQVERLTTSNSTLSTQSSHMLLTIGSGFRSLLDRFVFQIEANDDIVAGLWRIDDWSN